MWGRVALYGLAAWLVAVVVILRFFGQAGRRRDDGDFEAEWAALVARDLEEGTLRAERAAWTPPKTAPLGEWNIDNEGEAL